jgi:tripartite-type tricarboxylate transporter receptor subunit TctC
MKTGSSIMRTALFMTLAAAAFCASAQSSYPNRPIKLVVGFPAGGASDVAARAVGQKLAERLGQAIVVENRAGAASNIGSDFVAKSTADGYTLLLATISLSINPSLYPKLSYDALRDFVPISQISSAPFLLVVNPSQPYRTLAEFLAAAKSAPQPFHYASAGNGSGAHLFMEYFASSAGIKLAHVPYKGAAPAMNDVLSGAVPLTFDNIITTLPLAKAGRLRPLAISTARRSVAAPDIPTLAELGIAGFDATAWFGFFAPAGTPSEIVKHLHEETVLSLQDPQVRERLLAVGSEPVGSSPAEFARFFRAEIEKWGKVVRSANVKID